MKRSTSSLCAGAFALAALLATPRAAHAQTDAPPAAAVPLPPDATPAALPPRSMQDRAMARAEFIRAACLQARTPDYFMWVGAAALIAGGGALATIGLTSDSSTRSLPLWFIVGVGPGLVLGGIGVPFARGIIDAPNPLTTTCRMLLHARPEAVTADDLNTVDRLLIASGQPDTPILPILLAIATAATGAFVAVAVATDSRELTQLSGGIAAAVVTGWFLVPHTPQRSAALSYTHRMSSPEPVGGVPTPIAFALPGHGLGAGLRLDF